MSDQKYPKPLTTPSPEAQRFWEGTKKHELWIPYCRSCENSYWYPRDFCPQCGSRDVEWRQSGGKGRVYTFAIHYRAFHPGWTNEVPYVTALIDLDDGVRIFSNLVEVEADPKAIRCEMPVEVVFEDVTDEITLAKFRPVSE
ncbi:MAG: Zn-ribbon domain-containing OB-fold protein [Chloroflexi bacterium]|nr:Zn-ribbon domain-containing OB-fold protein [Chloroflexota bacterium]